MVKHLQKIILAAVMLLASNGVWAYDFQSGGLNYNITSNTAPYTVEITGFTSYAFYMVIPSSVTYQGITYSVTSIDNGVFSRCPNLISVTIPNSITCIGQQAFANCTNLIRTNYTGTIDQWCGINFGDGVANPICMSHNLYINDSLITNLVIPNTIDTIKPLVFLGDTAITAATIPNSVTCIGHNAFHGCSRLDSVSIGNSVTSIDSGAFYLCKSLTSLNIPNSVRNIDYYAFASCTGLSSLTIGNSVTNIGKRGFQYCTSLTSIDIPNSVTNIGQHAFANCSGITSLNIPCSVVTIGAYAFQNCTGLDTLVFNADSCTFIGSTAFDNCVNITTLRVGNNVKTIPSYAFNSLVGLTYLTLGDSLQYIGMQAFQNCSHLPSVSIPNLVTNLDTGAFSGCSELYSVSVGKRVGVIRPQTFANCTWLTNVTIGEGVTMIDQNAFSNSNRISTLTMKPTTPPLIYSQSLSTLGDSIDIYVPCNAIQAYRSAPHWGRFVNYHGEFVNEITCTPNNAAWGSVNILEQPSCTNGGVARIQAVPNAGCRFLRWSDGNTQNPRTLTVTQDTTLVAYFTSSSPQWYNFVVMSEDTNKGRVQIVTQPTQASPQATIIALPNTGYTFARWSDGNTQNPRSLTVTQDTVLVACFTQSGNQWFNFAVVSEDPAKGTVQVVTQPTQENPQAIIVALPNTGYTFTRWSDGNTQNPRTLTVTQDTVLIAFFASNQGIAEAENDNIFVRTVNGHIMLEGVSNERVYVSDVLGRVVYNATVNERAEIAVRKRGVYFVKVGNRPAQKVVVIQ